MYNREKFETHIQPAQENLAKIAQLLMDNSLCRQNMSKAEYEIYLEDQTTRFINLLKQSDPTTNEE